MSFLRETNKKCLVISGALMASYWLVPSKNQLVFGALGVFSYATIGWYDMMYDCDTKFFSKKGTYSNLFGRMKPEVGDDNTYGGPIRGRRLKY